MHSISLLHAYFINRIKAVRAALKSYYLIFLSFSIDYPFYQAAHKMFQNTAHKFYPKISFSLHSPPLGWQVW